MRRVESENATAQTGINPRRAHFNAGTAKNSSGASFAQALRAWLAYGQTTFALQKDFASAINVSLETLQYWLMGRAFPSDPLCDKLFSATGLECFGKERDTARREHEQKRGLSHSAISKRKQRQYLTPEELAECQANPEKAFTIRGDEWIACLECGRLLKFIRAVGPAAHLKEHGISDEQYRTGSNPQHPRYGKNRALVCVALSATKRAASLSSLLKNRALR
jgi:hypothetical protein